MHDLFQGGQSPVLAFSLVGRVCQPEQGGGRAGRQAGQVADGTLSAKGPPDWELKLRAAVYAIHAASIKDSSQQILDDYHKSNGTTKYLIFGIDLYYVIFNRY